MVKEFNRTNIKNNHGLTDKMINCINNHLTKQYECQGCASGTGNLHFDNGCNTYRSVMAWWNNKRKV